MKCGNCGSEITIRAEFCPRCGHRNKAGFDTVARAIHEDAALRRGEKIESALRWILMALLCLAAVLYGFNDAFDKPLLYDGSALPAVSAGRQTVIERPVLERAYADPRPNPPLANGAARVFAYRYEPMRSQLRAAYKGDVAAEKQRPTHQAVADGLKFLSMHQNGDGSFPVAVLPANWDQRNTKLTQWGQVGVTSLALLAFLGEGEDWTDPAHKTPYADKVVRTIRWLLQHQDAVTGCFGPTDGETNHFMYNQGMATLAMAEAAGMSGDPILRQSAQKAVDFIIKRQEEMGGWNYTGSTKGGENDMSVTAWQVQALYAAKEAGLDVPPDTLSKALDAYKQACKPDGRVAYGLRFDDKETRASLRGIALMCRQLLGEPNNVPALRLLGQKLQSETPRSKTEWGKAWQPNQTRNDDTERAKYDPYMIYFATYGMFFLGGKDWDVWHENIKRTVVEMQDSDGAWRTNDIWTASGGTVYSTALSILTLQVYYRIQ